MLSIPLLYLLEFFLTILSTTIVAVDPSSEDSSSSTTIIPQSVPATSTHIPKIIAPSSNQPSLPSLAKSKPWSIQQQSGPINYYQFAQSPSYNFRSPLPSTSQSSFASLMSNLFSPFNKVMSRRAAGGKLFSLMDQFENNNNKNNANNNNNGLGLEYSGSVSSLEALNEAVNNVMMGLNGLQPNQANQLAGQLGSYLSAAAGTDASSKNGKKLFDFPKQWYKLLGEKLSGASEAAYSATVPLKESFMHTLKSFYSYIKPSRSQSSSPFGDTNNMVAAAAAAAASQDSLMSNSNSIGGSNQNNNPKRRQSDSYSGYYYNNINSKLVSQHPSTIGSAVANQQQYATGARYSHGAFPQHQHGGYGIKQLQHQQTRSPTGKMNQVQPVGEMMAMESQAHSSLSKQHYRHLAKQQPIPSQTSELIAQANNVASKSQYDQMLNQIIQAQIQQGQQQLMSNNNNLGVNHKHPSALYQKSKEIFSRFTKKRVALPSQSYNSYNTIPVMTDYAGQVYQRLPGQTVTKVANKLPTLPLVYNINNNNQQSQPPQQQQSNRIESIQSPLTTQSQHQLKPKNPHSYYTQQPMNQNPFGIQPVYPPPSQQQSGTTSISSTVSPMSTSTSVSISVHQSISSSYDDNTNENIEPQHIQYNPPNNMDHMKNYDDNSGNNISVQNNQGSVFYYYDQSQQQPQQGQEQSGSSSSSSSQDSEESQKKKKK